MLDFVHDEHQIRFGLANDFLRDLSDGDTVCRTEVRNLKAEREARTAHVQALDPLQTRQHSAARGLQLFQRRAQCGVDQGAGVCADVGPQVDVDHQCASVLQCGDQVLAQEGGFAGAAQAREEQA